MKTPSKKTADETVPYWIAAIVFCHLLGAALLMGLARIPKETVIIIFILAIIILFAGAHHYYISKKNGKRIIKDCRGITGERTSVVIGGLIFLETLAFPIMCAILGYYFRR